MACGADQSRADTPATARPTYHADCIGMLSLCHISRGNGEHISTQLATQNCCPEFNSDILTSTPSGDHDA